jgi:hypothetical protein
MNSPRIYVYKITFDEIPHYYYGVHKEKVFDEYYMGSPKTHKDFWRLYIPRKEYIKFFECDDKGYIEARKFEDILITPAINDEFCLNEHVGGFYSLEACKKGGKKGGKISGEKHKENKTGVCGQSPEKMRENGKKGGNKNKENKTGVCGQSLEKLRENGKKGGNKNKENKTGIFGRSPEKMSEDGKKSGKIAGNKHKKNKTGVCGQSPEKMRENGKKGGKTTSSQKWQCTETGYVSHAGGLTYYQNKRGIDTSNRIKVDGPKSWEITFEDGGVVVTYQTLKEWAKENEYSYAGLRNVREGKVRNHRGITKIVSF